MDVTFTAAQVMDAVRKATTLPVLVEQTGGNVATVFVGFPSPEGGYTLAIGPGSFDWDNPNESTFYPEELSLGADELDWDMVQVKTLEELTIAVRTMLLDLDERFVEVLVPFDGAVEFLTKRLVAKRRA